MVQQKPRVRKRAPKVRTGCVTCKRRRVKCDERKPTCTKCENLGLDCEGYVVPKTWIFEPQTSPTISVALRKRNNPVGPRKLLPKPRTTGLDRGGPIWTAHRMASATLPLLLTLAPSDEIEAPQLMHCYARMIFDCPVAWELELRPGQCGFGSRDVDILMLHLTSPVTKAAHLALATTALHFFQPSQFPPRLPIKYIQKAVSMIRQRIVEDQYDNSDLLHGICHLFLATVLQGDENAAVAHKAAARALVDQAGGIESIKPGTAHLLRYTDLHYAVETLQEPTFSQAPPDLLSSWFPDSSDEDALTKPEDLELNSALDLTAEATKHLPEPFLTSFKSLSRCANVLALVYSISAPPIPYLFWMAREIYEIMQSLLRFQPPTMSLSNTRTILILWIQLFSVVTNELVTDVDIRGKILMINGKYVLGQLSPAVRDGLQRWNAIVRTAKKNNSSANQKDDWLDLVDIVREMEVDQPVKFGPVYNRLLEMRLGKLSLDCNDKSS